MQQKDWAGDEWSQGKTMIPIAALQIYYWFGQSEKNKVKMEKYGLFIVDPKIRMF